MANTPSERLTRFLGPAEITGNDVFEARSLSRNPPFPFSAPEPVRVPEPKPHHDHNHITPKTLHNAKMTDAEKEKAAKAIIKRYEKRPR